LIVVLAAIFQFGAVSPCLAIDPTTPIIGPYVQPYRDLKKELGGDTGSNTSTSTSTSTAKPPRDLELRDGKPATKDWGQLTDYCDVQCTYNEGHGKPGRHQMLYPSQIPSEETRRQQMEDLVNRLEKNKKVEKPIPNAKDHLEPLTPEEMKEEHYPGTGRAKRNRDRIIADRVDRIGSTPNIPRNFGPLVPRAPAVAVRVAPTVRVPPPAPRIPTFAPPPPHINSTITSDVRLKKDIVPVGQLANGLRLYRFRYRWSDELYVGVMAQEVARIAPDAVVRGSDGYLRVDYDRLGVKFQTWQEWTSPAAYH
jgi:hypothetical protein